MNEHSHQRLAEAFDLAAPTYDALYRENPIMAWLRAASLGHLQRQFRPGSYLLEIGCGTGDEAIALGRLGYTIVATDISATMIEIARAKARVAGLRNIAWYVLPAGRIDGLQAKVGSQRFDGAYSSFGALNCEPQLQESAGAVARLLPPQAPLVCSIMNRWCAWEIGWYLFHLRPRQAFRRVGAGWIEAGLATPAERLSVPVRYYAPRAFARAFSPHFSLRSVRALPVALPPPYLAPLVQGRTGWLDRLGHLDQHLMNRFPFHSLGDHFLAVMVRTGVDTER